MKPDANNSLLRTLCLAWAAASGLVWGLLTAASLSRHAGHEPASLVWFRTGALLSMWAGLFAWKALQPPRG